MKDSLTDVQSIYDRLNTYKLSSFRLSDSGLKLAMDNLDTISLLT